jgi:integrase
MPSGRSTVQRLWREPERSSARRPDAVQGPGDRPLGAQGRDANAKRVQLGTYETKREAKVAEDAYKRRRPGGDTTVAEWRTHWLTVGTWKESTRRHYEERTKSFAEEHGKKKLGAINRSIARDFVAAHPSCHACLSGMFGAALYEDDEHGNPLLQHNPFAKLVKQTAKRRDLQSEWLTAEDVAALEETAFRTVGAWAAGMVRFAAETGVRPGELFVIEHTDLHHEDGVAVDPPGGRVEDADRRPAQERPRAGDRAVSRGRCRGRRRRGTGLLEPPRRPVLEQHLVLLLAPDPGGRRPARDGLLRAPTLLRHAPARGRALSDRDVAEQLGHTDGGELVRKVYGHPSKRKALGRIRRALNQDQEV